jgi:phosphoglucosamine mutase
MTEQERQLFGTDGIRGIANSYPMDGLTAFRVGQAIAHYFKNGSHRHRIVIGKDTRLSGYLIENAMLSGIVSMGVDVYLLGPLPTPGIAFLTTGMRADAGVVISASHNSYEYNGIKVFDKEGFKLSDEIERTIEGFIASPEVLERAKATPEGIGKAFRVDDAVGRYVVFLKSTFPRKLSLKDLKIVLDCANGAAYKVAPEVFRELGAEVYPIGINPDGKNINRGVGATHPETAQRRVREVGADIGIILDGDADRLIVVDDTGTILDGDAIMAIMAIHLLEQNALKNNTLVATVASNLALELLLKSRGGKLVRTPVGDRYVSLKMRELDCNLGGEESGHLIFLDYNTTGDGILAALQLLKVMLLKDQPLSRLREIYKPYPRIKRNIEIHERIPVERMPDLQRIIEEFRKRVEEKGRVLFRYSGTEPKARILLEGEDELLLSYYADQITEALLKYQTLR